MLNLHHSRSPHFPSVLHSLANFALVKLQCGSGSGSFILDFSLLSSPWPWESKFCAQVSKPLCKLLVENKQQKQLIDRAKPNDGWCTPNLLTVPFHYHFDLNGGILSKTGSWETVSFSISSSIKLAPGMSSAVRSTWSSAMLVILNLPRGLLSLTSMQLRFFSGNGVLRMKLEKKNPGLERDLNPWPRDTGAML